MQAERLFKMLETVKPSKLTEYEISFIRWLSSWDDDTVQRFINLIKKVKDIR